MNSSNTPPPSFSRLNNLYGSSGPAAAYKWNEGDVVLPQDGFNESNYLDQKFEALCKKQSDLPQDIRQTVFATVVRENKTLLFELASSKGKEFENYNKRFDFLVESAFANAEHEFHVKKSRETITKSRSDSGWMSLGEVTDLVRLNGVVKKPPPDSRKFVPKERR